MIPAGQFIEQLYSDVEASSDEEKKSALRRLNLCLIDIAKKQSWQELRRTTTISFPGTSAGVLLPANLAGIDAIYNSDIGLFQPREKGQIVRVADVAYRWCISGIVTDPLRTIQQVSISKLSSNVNGLNDNDAGEYIVFSGRLGVYRLASQTAISETFFEEAVSNQPAIVRPAGTQYVNAYDPDGNYYSGSVTLDYWILPQPITDPAQTIPLPTSDALSLFTIMRHVGLKSMDEKRADRYRREYAIAYAEMSDRNPIYQAPNIPMGMNGNLATFAAQP